MKAKLSQLEMVCHEIEKVSLSMHYFFPTTSGKYTRTLPKLVSHLIISPGFQLDTWRYHFIKKMFYLIIVIKENNIFKNE